MKEDKLTDSFAEIFDFLDLTKSFKLTLAGENGDKIEKEVDGEMKRVDNEDVVSIDLVFGKNTPEFKLLSANKVVKAQLGDIFK